jgi:hypothetical protein
MWKVDLVNQIIPVSLVHRSRTEPSPSYITLIKSIDSIPSNAFEHRTGQPQINGESSCLLSQSAYAKSSHVLQHMRL